MPIRSLQGHAALFCVALGALAAPTLALADASSPPPPPGTPSINEYVEMVPTATGGIAAGAGMARTKLPRLVVKDLQRRHDTVSEKLQTVATSSAFGAPQHEPSHRSRGSKTSSPKAAASPLNAAVSSVTDSTGSHVYRLLAAMVVVTIVMVWAAVRRRMR